MGIKFERVKELFTAKAFKEFSEWMKGQTVDAGGVFEDDFLRFVKRQPVID